MNQKNKKIYVATKCKRTPQSVMLKVFLFLVLILNIFTFGYSRGIFHITAQESGSNKQFTDTNGHFAQNSIEKWGKRGIIKGDGLKFRPDSPITRGEFALIINRLLDFESPTITRDSFQDLKESFYTDAILSLSENKILLGSDKKIRAQEPITREEAAVVLLRAFQVSPTQSEIPFSDRADISPWAQASIAFMAQNKFMNGYQNKVFPKNPITRAEFVKILDHMISDYIDSEEDKITSDKGFVIVKTKNFELKDAKLNHVIILCGNVENIKIQKSEITRKLVVINRLFKHLAILESKIADMSSHLKNIEIEVDKNSTLPKTLNDLKHSTLLKNVQIKMMERETIGAPIANNDSDVYQPILPDRSIPEQTPPRHKDEDDIATLRDDLWIHIAGISNNGEIILQASDDLSNFNLPKEALILNAKNGENTGSPILLHWEESEEQTHLSKLEDIRAKKIGQYSFYARTLHDVLINENNYKKVKLKVIIQVVP